MEKSQCQKGSPTASRVVFKVLDILKDYVNLVLVDYLLVSHYYRKVDIINSLLNIVDPCRNQ